MAVLDDFSPSGLQALFERVLADTLRRGPSLHPGRAGELAAARIRTHMAREYERLETIALAGEDLAGDELAFLERMYDDGWQPYRELERLGGSRTVLLDLEEPMALVSVDEPYIVRAEASTLDDCSSHDFDAGPWAERAGDAELVAIAVRRWAVPREIVPAILEIVGVAIAGSDVDCALDEATACAWVAANRPAAWAEISAARYDGRRGVGGAGAR